MLEHRGPDDEGVVTRAHLGLGHRRLSILDLSPAGHQPMGNEDSSILLVMNGEIYNYRELRDELAAKGHCFSSQTDTETIIHLYEEEGTSCLQKLRGMFAFALWDSNRQLLFLARDRLGKKPLVYSLTSDSLVFASEIKSLLCDPAVQRQVDPEALHQYLTYQYVPAPLTIFSTIEKLPPAHYLLYRNGSVTLHRYWELSYKNKLEYKSLQEYREHFLEIFREAVRIRLRSDVPFGAFLSGGIDSSFVVAVMSSMLDRPVKTFSIGFEEKEYDELPYARMVAGRYGTDHHEFIVTPDIKDLLPKLVWHYNEPFADSSAVPTWYLAQMTRRHVTVALNGDGSDESFAGYSRYAATRTAALFQKIASRAGLPLLQRVLSLVPEAKQQHSFIERLRRFVRLLCSDAPRWHMRYISHFDTAAKKRLYTKSFGDTVQHIDSADLTAALYASADGAACVDKLLSVEVLSYLPEDLLVKVDIATMAHSLEARSPFLDHKVMEFAAALPPKLKLNGRETKYFLKQVLADFVPREILSREKMGFGVPIDRWLRHELREMTHDLLLDQTASERGYFEKAEVQRLLDEHNSGRVNHCYRIWNLLCLELWHRAYMDQPISSP
jgi:asparagine synthase (glutamine-hydrolysing)